MEPIFPKWTNKIPLFAGIGIIVFIIAVVLFVWYYLSPKYLSVGYSPRQPIPFSHQLHAGQMGMDCRYCHSTVEKTSFAALPTTSTCMGCHNKVLPNSIHLEALRESNKSNKPIEWVHVYSLPRYVHFDHSAHLSAGVGCISCHSRVDAMAEIYQATPLSMGWCLECHRNPGPNIIPKSELTNMLYDPHLEKPTEVKQTNGPESCGACHY